MELRVKIPVKLKERLESKRVDIDRVVQDALEKSVNEIGLRDNLIALPPYQANTRLATETIPPGHFMRVDGLSLEEYEAIVDETSWEYIDGKLIHHSPESNKHNAILNFLIYRARSTLDPSRYIVRVSRVALSIDNDKPEPDLMVFDKDDFRKLKRGDGTESEIIGSTPLLVIEVVSPSSMTVDEIKQGKYLSKGVREFWQVFLHSDPVTIIAHVLKKSRYEPALYEKGEIRSRQLPDFSVTIEELVDPDTAR